MEQQEKENKPAEASHEASHPSLQSPEKDPPNPPLAPPHHRVVCAIPASVRQSLSPPKEQSISPVSPGPGQPAMPRRNSFQFVTIHKLDDRRFSSSVPTSISEEKLNLVGTAEEAKREADGAPAIAAVAPSHQSPPSRTTTPPQIVEPAESTTAQINGGLRSSISAPPPPSSVPPSSVPAVHPAPFSPPSSSSSASSRSSASPQSMLVHQFGLHGLGNARPSPAHLPSPQNGLIPPPAPFSASYGPGQIQTQQQHEERGKENGHLARRSSSASTGAVPSCNATQPSNVAIDSKIEQAMDLVKTHLIYAVRDEIELLRSRIVDLETTVLHLESENAILREHIEPDVLSNLCLLDGKNAIPMVPSPANVAKQHKLAFTNPASAAPIAQP